MGSLSVQCHLSLSSSSLHLKLSSRNLKCNATLSGYKLSTSRCEEAFEFHYHVFSIVFMFGFLFYFFCVVFFFFDEWSSSICDNKSTTVNLWRSFRCVALFEAHGQDYSEKVPLKCNQNGTMKNEVMIV